MAYLVYKANRIELETNSIAIGRSKNCELVIDESTVSRNHAIIKQIGEKYYIIDSGSSNGTFKDGKRVHSPVLLENKSLIQCGNAQVIFYDNIASDDNVDETLLALTSNFIVNSIVLVADIKGYTTFSENVPIRKVSKFMSSWLKDISSCIENSNGYIDSFIGDCVYVRWDVSGDKDLVYKILNTAKKMNEMTNDISSKITDNKYILNLGVGVHIGDIIVGADTNNTGLGDVVNTAFRLEGLTRNLDVDIVISEEIYSIIKINKPLIDMQLKGKLNNSKICAIKFEDIDKWI